MQFKRLIKIPRKTIRIVDDFAFDKTVKTKHDTYMKFGTFLNEVGDFFDTVHFPPSLKQYPLLLASLYLLKGVVNN